MQVIKGKWSFKIHFVASLMMILVLKLFNTNKQAASIGIIGGVDGPTAMFVTGKVINQLFWVNPYSIFLFIILLLLYKPVKLRIEKKK